MTTHVQIVMDGNPWYNGGVRTFTFVLPAGDSTFTVDDAGAGGTTLYRLTITMARWDATAKTFSLDVAPTFKTTDKYVYDLESIMNGNPVSPLIFTGAITGLIRVTVKITRGTVRQVLFLV